MLACDHDNSTSFKRSSFTGSWSITLSGDYLASGGLTIREDGQFFEDIPLHDQSGFLTISGTITDTGVVLNGQISQGGSHIGSIQGDFSGNLGNGSWQTSGSKSGTWGAGRLIF